MLSNLLILVALLIGWGIGHWPTRNLIRHLQETNEKWAHLNTEIINLHHNTLASMNKPYPESKEPSEEELHKEFSDMVGGRL